MVLERLELVQVATSGCCWCSSCRSGVVRTIFVEVPRTIAPDSVQRVAQILNERLAGLPLREIRRRWRTGCATRMHRREAASCSTSSSPKARRLFDLAPAPEAVVLGSAQLLAEQPEFASNDRMRDLLELTERRDLLQPALEVRQTQGLTITIGGENADPRLAEFTLVTSSYRRGT